MNPHHALAGLASLLGTAVLGLAACSSAPPHSSRPPRSTTQPPTGTGGSTTTLPGSSTTAAPRTTLAAASGLSRCDISELSARAGQSNGATGHIGQVVSFTNISTTTCTLHGYPGLQMLSASGQAIYTNVLRTPSVVIQAESPTTVTLAPHQEASFTLGYADQTGFGSSTCPTSVNLEVTPPNAYSHLVVPDEISAYGPSVGQCGAINVSPVYPGSGAQP